MSTERSFLLAIWWQIILALFGECPEISGDDLGASTGGIIDDIKNEPVLIQSILIGSRVFASQRACGIGKSKLIVIHRII